MIREIMQEKNITEYRLSKISKIPYTTIHDICSGKAKLENCSARTVFRLSKALDVPMDVLLEPYMYKRTSFDVFKSTVCHRLKELGDLDFMIEVLEQDNIRVFYERKWFPESLYLLAMLDYLARLNNISLCDKYDDLRRCKLEKTVYPAGILCLAAASGNEKIKEDAKKSAIPEFIRFNIVESEIRNVV